MKILLITVRSDFGGGTRHVDQLINNLPEDIEIYLAYPHNGIPYGLEWNSNFRIKNRVNIPFRKFAITTLFEIAKFRNLKKNRDKSYIIFFCLPLILGVQITFMYPWLMIALYIHPPKKTFHAHYH